MREACIILPAVDPDHVSFLTLNRWPTDAERKASQLQSNARADFVRRLATAFGGCTITEGFGYRENAGSVIAESVKIYTFAVQEYPWAEEIIDTLATTVALALRQKAVYVRYPNGDVSIIDLTSGEKHDHV